MKKYLWKNKRGYSAVNVIMCVLVILLTFSLLIEITFLGKRYSYMAQTTTYVSRIIGEQGGIQTSTPSGYMDPSLYTKSSRLYSTLNSGFSKAGFDTWAVYIDDVKLKSSTRLGFPEKTLIPIRIRAGFYPIFKFNSRSNRLVYIETERNVYSSFTPRTSDIDLIK